VLQHLPAYRETVRGLTPWPVQEYIWASCFRTEAQTQQVFDCPSPITEAEAQAIVDGYRSSPALLPQLRFWMATNGLAIQLLEEVKGDAGTLGAEIDAAVAH
jgi:hypothetical protein